jgi:dolichol-phosphate mannosyltransferase
MDAITAFSIKPLKIASLMGIGFGVLGLLGIVYALLSWLFYSTITGWKSVIIAVFLLSSVQLITLGILGEYIGRLYMESKQRPLFIIAEAINFNEPYDSSA